VVVALDPRRPAARPVVPAYLPLSASGAAKESKTWFYETPISRKVGLRFVYERPTLHSLAMAAGR
jgi:hypothetical protein